MQKEWGEFVQLHEQSHGPNPPLASLAYHWLGSALAKAQPQPFYFGPSRTRLRDGPGAMAALEKSIALDPCHLAPHLKLCELYEALKLTSQRNRLLDAMTVRFPDRKEVLLQAGRGCLDREAFHKGLEYLERALELDRLDPAIPDAMAIGRLRLAFQSSEGRLDQARQTWERSRTGPRQTG